MKIRTDYVSNSSSSSFVLAQNELFEFFDITKVDIMDALLEAYGRSYYDEEVASVMKSVAEHPEWHEDDIKFGSFGPIWVYDLWDKDDRKEAIERWGGLLKGWDANNCHYVNDQNGGKDVALGNDNLSKFNNIINEVSAIMNTSRWNLLELSTSAKYKVDRFILTKERNEKTGEFGYYELMPEYVGKFLRGLRAEAGIMTNLDVIKAKVARFFVHADNNQLTYGDSSDINEKFDTEAYTFDRICEILLVNLIKSGRIKPDDPKFLEFMTIDDEYLSDEDKKHGEIYDFHVDGLESSCSYLEHARRMIIMKNDNEILLLCDCSSAEHQLIVRWDNDDKEVYVNVHLANMYGFWQRLWHGLKYAFGHKSKYGAFDEIILRKEDADNLQKVVNHLRSV